MTQSGRNLNIKHYRKHPPAKTHKQPLRRPVKPPGCKGWTPTPFHFLPYSSYNKVTYETRSGVSYQLTQNAHFTQKNWSTTETKQVYVPAASYGGQPAHYETRTVTTSHTGTFLDYYTVNEDQQIGYETKTDTYYAYFMDSYNVKEARQNTWQTSAWVRDKTYVNDIVDKEVQVAYQVDNYGSSTAVMPTAANSSTTYSTVGGVEHRYQNTPHFIYKEWQTPRTVYDDVYG